MDKLINTKTITQLKKMELSFLKKQEKKPLTWAQLCRLSDIQGAIQYLEMLYCN